MGCVVSIAAVKGASEEESRLTQLAESMGVSDPRVFELIKQRLTKTATPMAFSSGCRPASTLHKCPDHQQYQKPHQAVFDLRSGHRLELSGTPASSSTPYLYSEYPRPY